MRVLPGSTSRRNKTRDARRYLRRQGLKPIDGSGRILPDGTVAVPLINGAVAHVAFTTVTTMHCRCVATSAPRADVVRALDVLFNFVKVTDAVSASEPTFQIAAE